MIAVSRRIRVFALAMCSGLGFGGLAVAQDHAPSPQFDSKAAIKLSQDAIGRPPADATFTTADGGTLRLSELRGKPFVISLVYTSCYHICPTTTRHLANVVRSAQAALGSDSFRVLTIGFDTPNDTPAAMRHFAREQDISIPGWEFLSADASTVEQLQRDLGFMVYATPKGFDHLIQASVVDAEGKVYRQVYGMNFDTPLLVEPLKELVLGKPRQVSVLESIVKRIRLYCTVYDPATDGYRFDYSIFVEIFVGITAIGVIGTLLVREWRRKEPV